MRRTVWITGILLIPLMFLPAVPAIAGGMMRLSSVGDSDGAHADLVVRKVTVTPIKARSGDPIRIEVVWMYWGNLINNYFESTEANVLANGKVVASVPFDYHFGAFLGDEYRHTFTWDTTGMAPGQYHIRAEVPLRLDATPQDNFLDVKDPLVLLSADFPVPAGQDTAGRSAVEENPAWKKR